LEFKTEVCLLFLAITLFVVSAFFFSYQTVNVAFSLDSNPYRGYALAFVGFGSCLMVTASVSYSKRSKNILQ
jgi:hypothetical protein